MKTPSGSCQIVCKLIESVHERLKRFHVATIVAGVGLLVLVLPAEARIVYTPTNVTITAHILHTQGAYGHGEASLGRLEVGEVRLGNLGGRDAGGEALEFRPQQERLPHLRARERAHAESAAL